MPTPLRNVRIDDELWEAARVKAATTGVALSTAIRALLSAWIADMIDVTPDVEDD